MNLTRHRAKTWEKVLAKIGASKVLTDLPSVGGGESGIPGSQACVEELRSGGSC